jgi:hypothetical protein
MPAACAFLLPYLAQWKENFLLAQDREYSYADKNEK